MYSGAYSYTLLILFWVRIIISHALAKRFYAYEYNNGLCGIVHDGQNDQLTMKSTRRVLCHSLHRSLVRSHRSLIRYCSHCSHCSAALICSLARSLAHSGAHGTVAYVYEMNALISYHFGPICSMQCLSKSTLSSNCTACLPVFASYSDSALAKEPNLINSAKRSF